MVEEVSGRAVPEAALSPLATEPVPVSALSGNDQPRDTWIEWAGGECPVNADACVWIKRRWGRIAKIRRAADGRWSHRHSRFDIIAYRIVQS